MIVLALLALIPLLLAGPAAAALSVSLLKHGRRRALVILWIVLTCAAILLGFTIAHTFGNLFPGPGCFATLLTPAMVILALLVFLFQVKRLDLAAEPEPIHRRWRLIALLVISALGMGSGLSPPAQPPSRPSATTREAARRNMARLHVPAASSSLWESSARALTQLRKALRLRKQAFIRDPPNGNARATIDSVSGRHTRGPPGRIHRFPVSRPLGFFHPPDTARRPPRVPY